MLLGETRFQKGPLRHGYAGRTLHVDVGRRVATEKPVSDRMRETFVGGKGFDLWLLWNATPPRCHPDDPRNEIVISSGPLGGTPVYPGAGKSIVCTISPLTGSVMDSNVGGYFGPFLKFSGFDALEVQGVSDVPILVVIDGDEGVIRFLDASDLPSDAYTQSEILHERLGGDQPGKVSVVTAGSAARHTLIGCLNFSWYDRPRKAVRYKQAGRGGIGTVFARKNIVALAVVYSGGAFLERNAPADIERVRAVGRAHSKEIRELDPKQNEMAVVGTTHLTTIMNDYDLLPTHNYKFGSHERAPELGAEVYRKRFHKGFDGCWVGCAVACAHCVKDFELSTGPLRGKRVWVDGPEYETVAGCGSNCGTFDPDAILEINFYCDAYGVDTISFGTAMAFVMECFEAGILDTAKTGGLDLGFGNWKAAIECLHQAARGEGFGAIFGQGIRRMKQYFVEHFGADPAFVQDIGMEAKGLEFSEYMTKESLAQQGGYGLALKGPQHDEAWLIFLDMVHNFMPTFEQKAEALHWFPMWRTWFGLNGLCKLPWNDIVPADNRQTAEPAKVIRHVEWYAEFFSATTGREVGPDDLVAMSEKVYNFQRIFNLRQGYGRREHDAIPYRAMGPVTEEEYLSRLDRYDGQLQEMYGVDPSSMTLPEKVAFLRRRREERYEQLKDAVYARRGWTLDGVPTLDTVRRLGIDFPEVVETIAPHQG
ncbi:MAG: aldehyde:ferredoxin oxidoreductase [Deltaproteobacteria bacterium]|nr:aldehyde:ferredoxin oxidoreductase [Deltaproteobacteria bacterium]